MSHKNYLSWCVLRKYEFGNFSYGMSQPNAWSLANNRSCSKQSKALDRSEKSVVQVPFWSNETFYFSTIASKHCCEPYSYQNSNRYFEKIVSKELFICLYMQCSASLHSHVQNKITRILKQRIEWRHYVHSTYSLILEHQNTSK